MEHWIRNLSCLGESFIASGVQTSLDRMVAQCRTRLDCLASVMSVLDDTTQRFLAKSGTDLQGTERSISFCKHAVDAGKNLLVKDASKDDRFANNPLVLNDPQIRSYAGCLIYASSGDIVGTICAFDPRPNHFDTETMETLQEYAFGIQDLLRIDQLHQGTERLTQDVLLKNEKLKMSDRVFRQAERIAKIGSWELEAESGKLYWSEGAYRLHGRPLNQVISLEEALLSYVDSDRAKVRSCIVSAIRGRSSIEFEACLNKASGGYRQVRCFGEYLEEDDDHPARLVGIIQDITSTYETQAALEHAAYHDSLTGLLNRHAFDRVLKERLNHHNNEGENVVVLLIDLDGFKDANDTLGHVVGDMVLEDAAQRISRTNLNGSVVARWGGDEFVIVLPLGTTVDEAKTFGQDVLARIKQDSEIAGRSVSLSATCGLACSEKHINAKELIRRADTALYHGKRRGAGEVYAYHPDLESSNIIRLQAIEEVRSALRDERLFAGYQPIVDLASGSCVGFEALMRLITRADKQMTASELLPALIDPLISKEVSRRMALLISQDYSILKTSMGNTPFVSLNASEADLLSENFADNLIQIMQKHDVDLRHLVLEVTETMLLVNDTEAVRKVLLNLRDAGMRIALDDFGTGFSSLSHLRDFPINKVKIDGSFVQGIIEKQESRSIVQAIIAMATNLGMDVIAEGIETDEQREALTQMGCTYGQGYLFSQALSASQIALTSLKNWPKKCDNRVAA